MLGIVRSAPFIGSSLMVAVELPLMLPRNSSFGFLAGVAASALPLLPITTRML